MLAAPATTAVVTTTAVIASIAGRRALTDTKVRDAAGLLSFDEAMALSAEFSGVATNRLEQQIVSLSFSYPTKARRRSMAPGFRHSMR